MLKKIEEAQKHLNNQIFSDGLHCHCDFNVGAGPCDICAERIFLHEVKRTIERLHKEKYAAITLLDNPSRILWGFCSTRNEYGYYLDKEFVGTLEQAIIKEVQEND